MSQSWEPVIGLEVHAQLRTKAKLFSSAANSFGAEPNTQTTEVDLGMPGVLPVINRRAVELALRAALALGCEIQPVSTFARSPAASRKEAAASFPCTPARQRRGDVSGPRSA